MKKILFYLLLITLSHSACFGFQFNPNTETKKEFFKKVKESGFIESHCAKKTTYLTELIVITRLLSQIPKAQDLSDEEMNIIQNKIREEVKEEMLNIYKECMEKNYIIIDNTIKNSNLKSSD